MSHNPYAPPSAVVEDIYVSDEVGGTTPFFAVSPAKFAIMSLCTFGLYDVYWFYHQWKRIAERDGDDIWPLARAIFGFVFCYPFFARIREYGIASGRGSSLAVAPLAIGFVAASFSWKLPRPYDWISLTAFLFLIPAQIEINRLNAAENPRHDRNGRMTVWNWVAILVGATTLLLAFAGDFLIDAE